MTEEEEAEQNRVAHIKRCATMIYSKAFLKSKGKRRRRKRKEEHERREYILEWI